ncbi:diguanylate cyclase [Viridibacterium curvum]|uniref:diguanylate cyclase n=1 Tax=Viridibacterium curvum TaxID=1101404 RepID=A0ABP9QT86_9RHOO
MVQEDWRHDLAFSLIGFGLGAATWSLGGGAWLALLAAAGSAALARHTLGPSRDRLSTTESQQLADRLSNERERHEATQQFVQRMLDVVPMPIYVKDAAGRIIIVNRAQAEQWGLAREEVIGNTSFSMAPDPERARLTHEEDARVLAGESIYKEEHTLDGNHGAEQFRVIAKARCEDPEGQPVIVCARFDTTQWRQAERTVQQALAREQLLRQRNQDFVQRVLDVIPDPFYIKDRNGRLLMVNEAFARQRGRSRESVIGLLSTEVELTPQLAADTRREDETVLEGISISKEQHYLDPLTGEDRFRLISKRPLSDMDGQPAIVVAHINITRWRIAERELERLAHEDALTGLPNRRHFLTEADRLASSATRHGHPLSLIIFDLDHFKQINDRHGHLVGDVVLRQVAMRLREQLRSEDLPCRWGGEEFVILLPMTDVEMAATVAERLRKAMAGAPLHVRDGDADAHVDVTISGGITARKLGETLEECLARADRALYAAKDAGRNCMLQG